MKKFEEEKLLKYQHSDGNEKEEEKINLDQGKPRKLLQVENPPPDIDANNEDYLEVLE